MKVVVQTRPRSPINAPPWFVIVDDPTPGEFSLTLIPADATDFINHVAAEDWLALHPELLPGILFVKWALP